MRHIFRAFLLGSLIVVSGVAQSQSTAHFIGLRVLKRVWFETGFGITLTPVQPFDSGSTGCSTYTFALIPVSHPHFKELYSAALTALASGTPIDAYVFSCASGWGLTFPSIHSFGIGTP